MSNGYRVNSIIIGLLFILTMLAGMVDAYFVVPVLDGSLSNIQNIPYLLYTGVFSVLFMSIGIVVISTSLYPIIRKQNETIAITYVSFRVIEGVLLIVGVIVYLILLFDNNILENTNASERYNKNIPLLLAKLKVGTYQISMMILGLGSVLMNISFFISRVIPRWLSIWGIIGYISLFLSAVLGLVGMINTTSGLGSLLYIPGGLWEFFVFPIWLFIKGFKIDTK